jgi:polysaccharide export outer membrane protein
MANMKTLTKSLVCALLAGGLAMSANAQLFGKKKDAPSKNVIDVSEKGDKGKNGKLAPVPANGKSVERDDYVLGIDDVVTVNVWREPEMSKQVTIRPDGKISLPLLGEFMADGKTPVQLQSDLKKKLETVVTNPEVTVIVDSMRSQKFTIIGEVGKPGSYPLVKPMTVLEAIALAGGFKDFANPKKMYILRKGKDGRSDRIPFNYAAMLKGDRHQAVVELESRDTIVVP